MPTLSREQMEAAIKAGGSVRHNGILYRKVEELPSKAELAKGNPEAEASAANDLRAQIDRLTAQLDTLTAPAKKTAKAESKADDGDTKDTKTEDTKGK